MDKLLNQVWLGDCLSLMNNIPDNSVDMIFADLPYAVTARNEWDKEIIPWKPLWDQYMRVAKPNAAIILTAIQPFTSSCVVNAPPLV